MCVCPLCSRDVWHPLDEWCCPCIRLSLSCGHSGEHAFWRSCSHSMASDSNGAATPTAPPNHERRPRRSCW